jgi:hypothetical protein
MLVVKVELHSAIDGSIEELGRMIVANDGTGTQEFGNYNVKVARKGQSLSAAVWKHPQREGRVEHYARNAYVVWELIGRALKSVGFAR